MAVHVPCFPVFRDRHAVHRHHRPRTRWRTLAPTSRHGSQYSPGMIACSFPCAFARSVPLAAQIVALLHVPCDSHPHFSPHDDDRLHPCPDAIVFFEWVVLWHPGCSVAVPNGNNYGWARVVAGPLVGPRSQTKGRKSKLWSPPVRLARCTIVAICRKIPSTGHGAAGRVG